MPNEIENYNVMDLVSKMEQEIRDDYLYDYVNDDDDEDFIPKSKENWDDLLEEIAETQIYAYENLTSNTEIMKAYLRDYSYDELRMIYDENKLCSDLINLRKCPFKEYLDSAIEDTYNRNEEGADVEKFVEEVTYSIFLITLCIKKLKAIDFGV